METPLRTVVKVVYITASDNRETDISADVSADLLNVTYDDSINDEADTVSVTLKDEKGKWAGTWSPTRGDKVEVTFMTESRGMLSAQRMTIDRLSTSGRPRVFTFDAVSVPLSETVRRTRKTCGFEKTTLKAIAKSIADSQKLGFLWDCEDDPDYDRVDQRDETDLKFLQRLASDAGFTVKVDAETLIIFDQKSYEKKTPVTTLIEYGGRILSWSFEAQQSERYKECHVKWRDQQKKTRASGGSSKSVTQSDAQARQAILDSYINGKSTPAKGAKPKKGNTQTKPEIQEYVYEDPDVDDSGQVYVVKKRCGSRSEAERLAKATLRKLNLRQLTGSLSLIGDPALCAGEVITLVGFGSFDGNFIIEKARHTMSGSGYITSIDVRRINNKY